ncbi:type II restriction m6 adenine DNA methyltransferase, Alw26I/Eco31I/Esp3I family [Sphingobacterium daejeonense]|nr:type II restriction m6 adenine DNA methyltransferase, Alw26I/Eco31I/Esp3I family [Sphingobacterium daejeonense]
MKILLDREGKRLKEYHVEVVNDELMITDEDGQLFKYNPLVKESQRVQETLFLEKENIIENCLFGVDINPNSVKICRLRLWIELLKNAYYKNSTELETLPNIDINIKCGNSLVSRFAIEADLRQALRKSKWTIDSYKQAVSTYRNAENKEQKREMEKLISDIKSDFKTEISKNSKEVTDLIKLERDYYLKYETTHLFEERLTKSQLKDKKQLSSKIDLLKDKIEQIKANKIYENAFEWRFEFPEVLNDEGEFIGFDVIIGNPPYKMVQPNNTSINDLEYFRKSYPIADFKIDLFHLFYQLGTFILKNGGDICFITPSSILNNVYAINLRNFINKHFNIRIIAVTHNKIFDEADVHTGIFHFEKSHFPDSAKSIKLTTELENVILKKSNFRVISQNDFKSEIGINWNLLIDSTNFSIFNKLKHLPILGNIFKN